MSTEKNEKNENIMYCETCDFKCSYKSDYSRHLLTAKHKILTNPNKILTKNEAAYKCICGKEYKHSSTLSSHKKKCNGQHPPVKNIVHESMSEATLISCFQMMMDSQAERDAVRDERDAVRDERDAVRDERDATRDAAHAAASAEQNRILIEAISLNEPRSITNNNTTTNNQFNLNVFLNEDCKDAFTLKEVADSIECTVSDLDRMDTDGYVATITRKILESIQHMSITERPIHCTDARRNTVCVKSKEGWEKNEAAMKCLNDTVYWVGNKLGRIVSDWRTAYPDHFRGSDSRREQYHRLIMDVTKVRDLDVEARIASKVCKGVVLDRKVLKERDHVPTV